jgi:hypothetical protein
MGFLLRRGSGTIVRIAEEAGVRGQRSEVSDKMLPILTSDLRALLRPRVLEDRAVPAHGDLDLGVVGGGQGDLVAAVDLLLVLDVGDLHHLLELGLGVLLLDCLGDGPGQVLGVELALVIEQGAILGNVGLGFLAVVLEFDVGRPRTGPVGPPRLGESLAAVFEAGMNGG